jgi:hypothetical protein
MSESGNGPQRAHDKRANDQWLEAPAHLQKRSRMNRVIYLIGLIVIVLVIAGYLGFR